MKLSIEQLKKIPKVQVSFQDDFSGSKREYNLTPQYVLNELHKIYVKPKVKDLILLWEKDLGVNATEYYLCILGQISEVGQDLKNNIEGKGVQLDGKTIIITMKNGYFNLPINSPVFLK
jgi:hypothetical protein